MATSQKRKGSSRAVLLAALILWIGGSLVLLRVAGFLPYPQVEERWSASYGWTKAIATPRIGPELMIGQAVLPRGPLSFLKVRFATYGRQPEAGLEALILKGRAVPSGPAEIERRLLHRAEIPAGTIKDNETASVSLPRMRHDWGRGIYLIVRALPGKQGNPVTLWTDQAREWPGPPADLISPGPDGKPFRHVPAPGHLSLVLGQDRNPPNLRQGLAFHWGRAAPYLAAFLAAGLLLAGAWLLLRGAARLGPVFTYAAIILICLLLMEATARVYLYKEIQTPLTGPMNLRVYRWTKELREHPIKREPGRINILLLGGSVLYKNWGRVGEFLERELNKACQPIHVRVVNLARTAHSSLDSLIKYRLLEDSQFDLVFVYHGINETRNNNVPPELFRDDYSHTEFYADIAVPEAHPESDWFRLPTVLHRMYNRFLIEAGLREQLGMREHEKWVEYGCDIKTDRPFQKNLEEMAAIAKRRGETLILSTFAIHIPPDYSLEKFKAGELDYSGHRSPIQLWGRPECVAKGVAAHNRAVRRVAEEWGLAVADLDGRLARTKENFDDICHLTPAGSQAFVKILLPVAEEALAKMEYQGRPRVPGLAQKLAGPK